MSQPARSDNVDALFQTFDALYGARLADMWKGSNIDHVKRVWRDALSGFTLREVKEGIKACRAKPWPPTLPEFLLLCRPPVNFEELYAEAQVQISRRTEGRDQWPSRAVYWAAVEYGFGDLRAHAWSVAKARWSRILATKLQQEDLAEIPDARPQLPAPGRSITDRETGIKNLAAIKELLARPKGVEA